MEAKELRIGNLFYDQKKSLCEVTRITKDNYQILSFKNALTYLPIKPIQLTEEWAIFFGYECLVEMACDFSSKSKYRIEITSEDLKKLKIHEAQNLYFSLTGQELKIN